MTKFNFLDEHDFFVEGEIIKSCMQKNTYLLCVCLSLRLLCLSVLNELHKQHPVSLTVLRGIWLSRCSKENPLFPLQDASVNGEKCYCRFALQAHTSGPAAQLCIFFSLSHLRWMILLHLVHLCPSRISFIQSQWETQLECAAEM